jgi:predicted metallo-beta-lactamase superfamily hydrolase
MSVIASTAAVQRIARVRVVVDAIANTKADILIFRLPPSRSEPRRVECVGDRIDDYAHSRDALDAPD